MSYIIKTMLVHKDVITEARQLASAFPSTKDMWTIPVVDKTTKQLMYFISSGPVASDLSSLMSDASILAEATGISEENATNILSKCIVVDTGDWESVLQENNLEVVQPE